MDDENNNNNNKQNQQLQEMENRNTWWHWLWPDILTVKWQQTACAGKIKINHNIPSGDSILLMFLYFCLYYLDVKHQMEWHKKMHQSFIGHLVISRMPLLQF